MSALRLLRIEGPAFVVGALVAPDGIVVEVAPYLGGVIARTPRQILSRPVTEAGLCALASSRGWRTVYL